jgi:hypothetical protein
MPIDAWSLLCAARILSRQGQAILIARRLRIDAPFEVSGKAGEQRPLLAGNFSDPEHAA